MKSKAALLLLGLPRGYRRRLPTLPFRVAATATGLVLTIGAVELKRQTLKAGSIFVS